MFEKSKFPFFVRRALWIFIAWMTLSVCIFCYDYVTLLNNNALTSAYNFMDAFTAYLIVAVCASVIGGIFTVNLMIYWLRRYAFWKALFLIVLAYTIVSIFIGAIGSLYINGQKMDLPMFHHEVVEELLFFFGKAVFLKNYFIWLLIVVLTLIVLMVNDIFGPGVFPDYLKGRYFQPKRERRIFMFADIKNATGIAEKLGEEKYFNFLKDFFRDIAPAIRQTRGEVYQYVGDEVVISWKMKYGLKNGNALACYFTMKDLVATKEEDYLRKYSVIPVFKVGYHFGNVMVGELGQVKREIAFSGDVLNTAARIVAKCNDLNVSILTSEAFANVAYQLPDGISRKDMGEEKLRGKAEEIGLVTYTRT